MVVSILQSFRKSLFKAIIALTSSPYDPRKPIYIYIVNFEPNILNFFLTYDGVSCGNFVVNVKLFFYLFICGFFLCGQVLGTVIAYI